MPEQSAVGHGSTGCAVGEGQNVECVRKPLVIRRDNDCPGASRGLMFLYKENKKQPFKPPERVIVHGILNY